MKAVLQENDLKTFEEDSLDEYGFFDDNRLKIPMQDPTMQRVVDAVIRGRRLGSLDDPVTMMADARKIDATKDLAAWLLAGGESIDLVDRAKPLDPWLNKSPISSLDDIPNDFF